MSRAGYTESDGDAEDNWRIIRWRGAVKSALRGKTGQAFLVEALATLDAMPKKRLIADSFRRSPKGEPYAPEAEFCTLGAVAKARGVENDSALQHDPDDDDLDQHAVAGVFGIAFAMACEIMNENDECGPHDETPEARWSRMRRWIESKIKKSESTPPTQSALPLDE